MIDRSILREVKSGPYMLKAGFQKGPIEFRTCALDVDTLPRACPALPYPTLAARGQDKRTPTYPTHKPDPLTPACTFELLLDVSRVKKIVSTLRAHARSVRTGA